MSGCRRAERWPRLFSWAVLLAVFGNCGPAGAVDLSARASILGSASRLSPGDAGYGLTDIGTPTVDQQGLRLMAEDHGDAAEWSLHGRVSRQNLIGLQTGGAHASELFRYRKLAAEDVSGDGLSRRTSVGWEIDRAVYKRRFGAASLAIGRQPVDFGSGRFWQPLNVFGAFAPTDLDTDYKPGIDAAVLNWYPSDFSSLTAVYALAPHDRQDIDDSAALYYRRQVGDSSQLALLAARVIGNAQWGGSFESDWLGLGWRVEGVHTRIEATGEQSLFWIAGADYQFESGPLVSAEWYDNGRGASTEAALGALVPDRLVTYGLQQQRVRQVLGLSARHDVTPLWNASYTVLASALQDEQSQRAWSFLHQLSLTYSMSNESDLLLSAAVGSGKGLDSASRLQSAFGAVPFSLTLRWRQYF